MPNLMRYSEETFESIKHYTSDGVEFWYARELQTVLEYTDWRNFQNAIFKAMEACKNSGYPIEDHFGDATKFTKIGGGNVRKISDYALSRYACYLIVMNGDSQKEVIAVGQTYFAVKTRQQELIEDYQAWRKAPAFRHGNLNRESPGFSRGEFQTISLKNTGYFSAASSSILPAKNLKSWWAAGEQRSLKKCRHSLMFAVANNFVIRQLGNTDRAASLEHLRANRAL